jgi:sigma-E factor negative regulatory protein RseC
MIEERARVVAIEGDSALLQTQRQSTCGSCAVKSGCGTSVLASVVGQKITQLKVLNTLNAQPGDDVMLGLQEHALVTGSLLVYVVPLLLLLVGAVLGEVMASRLGMDAELMPIVGGATGFILAVIMVRGVLQKSNTGQHMKPVMLRIVT